MDFSFSSALITAKRFLLSFSSALNFHRTASWHFREERFARNFNLTIEIGSCKILNLNPHHFLPLENFLPVSGIEPDLWQKNLGGRGQNIMEFFFRFVKIPRGPKNFLKNDISGGGGGGGFFFSRGGKTFFEFWG